MIDRIIEFSIKNKLIISLLVCGLIAWGSVSLSNLPIDAVPDITNNQAQVLTVAPALAAPEIERLVTFPTEQAMATIPGIEEIRSFSRFGLSVVTIVFKDDIDIYWARQQINERLGDVKNNIPAGMGTPELAPLTTGLGEIFQYVIHVKPGYEKKYSAMDLRTIQDWIVRRQLLGTEGVADVSSFGGYLKQYEIAVDPDKLHSMDVSIDEIFAALERNNQNTGGAYIEKDPTAYFIRSEGLVSGIGDIEKIPVKNNPDGTPVLIRNVALVQLGHATRYGAMTRNNEGEVVGAVVMMLKGANSSKVITNVKDRIAQIEKSLPEGVVIEPFLDRTKLVNNAIGTVTKNLAEGALIVIFVLVLLLGNMRAGLIVASVIPLAMLFAVGMMRLFGVSGNLMSLGAIDFGLIVDGAVIIVEATMHHLGLRKNSQRLTQVEMDGEVYESARKIRSSAAFGEIIILIVYLPILALVGVEGKMFRPMAQTVSFAILGAFILSLTYVPMVSALFLSKKISHKKNISDRIMDVFHRVYNPAIRFAVKRKVWVVSIAVIAFAGSLLLFLSMGGEFIPTLDEGDFAVETRVLTGSSINYTVETAQKASAILKKEFPDEVKEVIGKIGSSEIPTDPMPVESCDLMIILNDKDEWKAAKTRDELAEKMAKTLDVLPGVTFSFQQPIQMRFNELMTGARQDVVIKIYGENLDSLAQYAEKAGRLVNSVDGAEDIYVEKVSGLQQIVIKMDREKIAAFGLNVDEINKTIRAGFAGEVAGKVYEDEKRFDMVVRLHRENRGDISDIKNLFITAADGRQIPLEQVAKVDYIMGPNQIQRDDAKRRITIGFNVRGRDVESIVEEVKTKMDKEMNFSPGYYPTYGGTFKNLQEARNRLSIAVPVALLLIFILLFFTFNSIKQSLLIFTAIPLSAIGGVLALWLRGMPFSISAGVGFIALFGVAVLNGIVLIAEFNRLKKSGISSLNRIVLSGTATRLRPVIMTALVASLGFLPMAISNSSGAEVQRPLATVVIGGLVSATLLTLLVLPVLYILSEKIVKQNTKKITLIITVFTFLLITTKNSDAQTTKVSLDEALKTALQNNAGITGAAYQVDLSKQQRRTASDMGKTSISLMYGQYNSLNTDNNITASQNIPFPTVISNQSALGNSLVKGSELNLGATKNQLAYNVKSTYYTLKYLDALQNLLKEQDSLYANFAKSAAVKYNSGESNFLEKTTAETQYDMVKSMVRQNSGDIYIQNNQLQTLMNSATPVEIGDTDFRERDFNILSDSVKINGNPTLLLIKQQIEINNRQKKLEVSKVLPDITLGYFSQTLIGTQNVNGTDVYFNSGKRFTGVLLGLSIPLWYYPQVAKIKAADINIKIAESNYKQMNIALQGQYNQAVQEYLKNKNTLDYYKTSALPNANLLITQAQKAYKGGEIGYVEYLTALKNALSIKENHLSAINKYNQSVILLEYLAGIY